MWRNKLCAAKTTAKISDDSGQWCCLSVGLPQWRGNTACLSAMRQMISRRPLLRKFGYTVRVIHGFQFYKHLQYGQVLTCEQDKACIGVSRSTNLEAFLLTNALSPQYTCLNKTNCILNSKRYMKDKTMEVGHRV